MSNVDLDKAPLVAPKPNKIFGTVDTPVDFIEAFGAEKTVKRALSALLRVPIRFYRDNVIASEGDAAEHIFFVVRGSFEVAKFSSMVPATSSPFICPATSLVGRISDTRRSQPRPRQTQRCYFSNGVRCCPSHHGKVELQGFC
jgi:hypothetical protein